MNKVKKSSILKITNLLILLASGVAVGFGIGYLLKEVTTGDDNHSHSSGMHVDSNKHKSMSHSHGMYSVDENQAPTVSIKVAEDEKSGYNVTLTTTKFEFTPKDVNGENVMGKGHAHLYVDGEKVARLYGPYYHFDKNFDGTKTFKVTLNANDHSEYAVDGRVISAEQIVTHDHKK